MHQQGWHGRFHTMRSCGRVLRRSSVRSFLRFEIDGDWRSDLLGRRTFVEKHDQIDIAGRLSHSGEHGGGLAAMLCTMIDKVYHRLPHDAPMRIALGRDVVELKGTVPR